MNGSSSDSIPININPTTFEYTIENLLSGVYNLDLYGVIYHKKNGIIEPVNTYTMGDRHRYTITIPERPALKLESITTDSVHCYGGWDGKINIRMSGGVGKFNAFLRLEDGKPVDTIYNFNSNVTVTFSGLPAGRYTVSVVDTNGCTKDENGVDIISTVEVKQPAAGVEIFNDIQWEEPKCFGGTDGWAQIYFKGGYPPYTVEWRDSANALIPANPVGFDGTRYYSKVENIKSSTYRVTVRDSHYSLATPATEINRCGCYDTISFFVTEPPLLEVSIEERHYVTCYGDSDGVLVAHATGGRKHASGNPYTYEWSKISGGLSFITGTNDSILDNLYSGNYRVKVTDRNLICVAIDTFYLMQPDTLVVDTEVLQNVLCNGENTGSIIAVAKGGTPPYTYLWSNNETTQQIDNLSMGGYVVYVRDARYADNGITGHYCYAQAQAFITSPNGIEFNASVTHPTCNDYSDGSIVLNVTGGVAPYSYIWEDGSAESSRTDLPSGAYTVSVTDFNGCIISQAYRLTNPDPVTVNLGRDITLCKNQTVTIDGNTGIADASYEWTNAAGTALSYMSEYELREAGIYTLTATTVEGCRGSDEIAVSQSDDEIDVDFVIPTTIAGNTKLYAVNITRLSLDDIQWIIPEGAVLFEETEDRIQLLFSRNGNYTVGLTGYKGLCEMTVYKTVTVVDANDITEDESAEPLLKRFIVAPNPNDGNFDAVIELRESVEYRLILYDMNGSTVETTPVYTAVSNIIRFNSSALSAGMYLLKFVSNKTTSIFKVLIH
jgi:hypothetical protein